MKLSDLNQKDVILVKDGAEQGGGGPLKLSSIHPKDVTLVQDGPRPPTEGQSAIRGAIGGYTAGFDDEIVGGIGAAGRVAGVKNLGSWKPFDANSHLEFDRPTLNPSEIVDAYRENLDATRDEQRLDLQTNPKSTLGGNLAGAILSPAGKVGAAGKGASLGRASIGAGIQGAIYGAGASDSDLTRGEVGQFAKDTAIGGATGAIVPPALVGAGFAAKKGAQAAGFAGKKLFTSAFGVTEENVSKYLANPERINAAKSLGEIKDLVDESVGKLRDAVESGRATEAEAKDSLRALQEQVVRGLADKKVDTKDALRAAESAFQGAREKVLTPIKATPAPTSYAADVAGMVGDLKQKVRGESGQALEVLNKSNANVDLKQVFAHIDETIAGLEKSGTDEALSVAEKLKSYKERLSQNYVSKPAGFKPSGELETLSPAKFENTPESLRASGKLMPARYIQGSNEDQWLKGGLMGKEVSPPVEFQPIGQKFERVPAVTAPDAKKLVQGLDAITEYSPLAGSFDNAKGAAFKGVRKTLDQSLKDSVPEYRKMMEGVAQKAGLLEDANSAFGSPELAVGKLGRLNTPRGEFDRATLGKLEEAVGKAGFVTKDADKYALAQKILKDPEAIRNIERSLPEYQTLRQAMADVAKRNPKWTRAQIEQATAQERKALASAVGDRVFAERELDPFKGLSPASTESRLKSVMKGDKSNINNREVLGNLGKKSNQDFVQMADDLSVKDSFEKPFHHGARNTVLWTVIGSVFGGLPGGAIGATYGGLVDKYGPKMAKTILDGVVKVKSNPSVQTIRSLSLPEGVKSELEREFRVYMVTSNAAESRVPRVASSQKDADRSPSGGPDRWARTGIEKLGISDQATAERLLQSKEGKRLLIEASDLPPGSRALNRIKEQIQKGSIK